MGDAGVAFFWLTRVQVFGWATLAWRPEVVYLRSAASHRWGHCSGSQGVSMAACAPSVPFGHGGCFWQVPGALAATMGEVQAWEA